MFTDKNLGTSTFLIVAYLVYVYQKRDLLLPWSNVTLCCLHISSDQKFWWSALCRYFEDMGDGRTRAGKFFRSVCVSRRLGEEKKSSAAVRKMEVMVCFPNVCKVSGDEEIVLESPNVPQLNMS